MLRRQDRVAGVQLDLEPFDLAVPAQAYFYDQVAKNLAGENEEIGEVLGCANERFPDGRFFSVFTFASAITPQLGEMFTRYDNGYLVLSLYDLGPGGAGQACTGRGTAVLRRLEHPRANLVR